MKILVLDILINQTREKNTIPPDVLPRIYEEYRILAAQEATGVTSLQAYLKNKNGKMMRGAEHVFKYKLTDGDRILYTYGKFMPCIRDREKDALVLIGYAKHDEQGHRGVEFDFNKERAYAYVTDIVSAMDELELSNLHAGGFDVNDLYFVAELISSPDYMRNHAIYVVSEETMATLSPDKMEKVLSPEQDQCITEYFVDPKPTLVQGGAGTGKTLIAIHMLDDFNRSHTGIRGMYFTQSRELRLRVEKMYDVIKATKDENTIAFEDINEFCLYHLGLNVSSFVQTRQFVEFLRSRTDLISLCEEHNLAELDVWTEIRGTLKGAMSAEWTHTGTLSQKLFPKGIESLVRKGYFLRDSTNKQRFSLSAAVDQITTRAKNDVLLSRTEKEYIQTAVKYFSAFDADIRTLTKEQYMSFSEEDTTLVSELREVVWHICQEYEAYLKENRLYDENDLVRLMFEQKATNLPQFDFVVVDEVQDYTELQIFLIRTMCKAQDRIVFAGDGNQIINPTMFRESRLQMLFRNPDGGTNLRLVHLCQNFRCQEQIVQTANTLSELRRKTIGSKSIELEQPETSMRKGCIPFRLKYSPDNMRSILSEVIKYPRTAVLVADEQSKREVIGIIGEKEYTQAGVPCIFTVSEIKGMEYTYVVCFDLIGSYTSIWEQMLREKSASHKTKYRYYFNLLYVAMTRAQEYLCFIDKETVGDLETRFSLRYEERFDGQIFQFDRLSNLFSDWIEQAREFEQAGKYEEAISVYKKAHASQTDIYRCEINLAIQNRNFERAMQYCILTEDVEGLQQYLNEPMTEEAKILGTLYVSLIKNRDIPKGYKSNYTQLVDHVFKSFQEEEIHRGKQIIQNAYRDTLFKLVESTERIAGEIV